MKYLSAEDIIQLHDDILRYTGGRPGIIRKGSIESAADGPKHSYNSTIIQKASFIGTELTKGHPFVDGNKRTAALSIAAFLKKNGYALNYSKDEDVEIFDNLAACHKTKEDLRNWLYGKVIF
ncbi:MAG: type II toxin-antitoxin system death-on-curing family toxin [Planctomycetota bacterium]